MNEYGYFSKDVALKLDVNPSTLRQWCLAMEKEGYEFQRNEKEQRIFYERDISLLFEVKTLIDKTRNRDDAIKSVIATFKRDDNAKKTLSVHENKPENITLSKEELTKIIEMSVEKSIEKEREAAFKMFELKMNDVIEKRDRHLVQHLNESLEKKKLEIAAAAEETEKAKKRWFSIFKKKKNSN